MLATSRFTIPVSLIVPIEADADDAPHRVRHLLQLRYPELELIVVVSAGPALDDLKHGLSLSAAEVFYRKSLAGAAVRGLVPKRHRCAASSSCSPSRPASATRSTAESTSRAIDTWPSSTPRRPTTATPCSRRCRRRSRSRSASSAPRRRCRCARSRDSRRRCAARRLPGWSRRCGTCPRRGHALVTVGRRRLDLPPDGCPGFTIWRRDVVLDVGGFARGRHRGPCGHDPANPRALPGRPTALPHHPRRRAGRAGRAQSTPNAWRAGRECHLA